MVLDDDLYEVETDQGMALRSRLKGIAEVASLAEGDTCPRCGGHSQIFYGDPDGEHWCIACQFAKELGLSMNNGEVPPDA